MRPSTTIFLKEAREMARDRRVVNAAFIAPVFMIVLFIFLFGMIEQKVKGKPDLRLAFVVDSGNPLSEGLEKAEDVKVSVVHSLEDGRALKKDGKVHAIVEFSPDFSAGVANGAATVTTYYDSTEPLSQIAMSVARGMVDEMNKESVSTILEQHGLSRKLAEPIAFKAQDEQKAEGLGGSLIVGLIPYLIVLWAFYGGFSTVSDLVAGEKERGTLETLLVSPVTRTQVALGKFIALAVICFVSSLTTLLGVVVVGTLNLPITRALFPSGLHISALAALELFAVLVPLVVFFAGILLSVSAFAKNVREAQTYLTLVSFLIIMPAIFSQFIGFTGVQHSTWVRLTPVLNSAVALKEALVGTLDLAPLLMTVGVSGALGALMLYVSVRLFSREQILTRV